VLEAQVTLFLLGAASGAIVSPTDQATLDSIEALLVAEKTSVREALQAAFRLGELTGMIKMVKTGDEMVRDTFSRIA
jgi:predicted transcriptional regulator